MDKFAEILVKIQVARGKRDEFTDALNEFLGELRADGVVYDDNDLGWSYFGYLPSREG